MQWCSHANYRKRIDLDERLKRCNSIWNLTMKRRYLRKGVDTILSKKTKEEERDDSKKKHDGEKGKMLLEDDEMVVKKKSSMR